MTTKDNILFVTLDSCRLDTAIKAHTPHLDLLGPVIPSHTVGSFTLPAHMSFFAGFLPTPIQPRKLLGTYDRIWRSRAARSTVKTVYQWTETVTITEHYRRVGYIVHGLGGVQFFDPGIRANSLPRLFDIFEYHGVPAGGKYFNITEELTAQALELFVSNRIYDEPFFLFANLSETHFPYFSPGCTQDSATEEALKIMLRGQADKCSPGRPNDELMELLRPAHHRQVQSLEWIDNVIGRVLSALSRCSNRTLVVVCSDHGDSFGERGLIGHGHPGPEVMAVPMWAGFIAPSFQCDGPG